MKPLQDRGGDFEEKKRWQKSALRVEGGPLVSALFVLGLEQHIA